MDPKVWQVGLFRSVLIDVEIQWRENESQSENERYLMIANMITITATLLLIPSSYDNFWPLFTKSETLGMHALYQIICITLKNVSIMQFFFFSLLLWKICSINLK